MKLAYVALIVLIGYGYSDAWTDMKMPHPVHHKMDSSHPIKGVMSVSASDTFGTWVTTNKDKVYVKKTYDGPWILADPSLKQISVSNLAMWGVNKYGEIFYSASKSPHAKWMKVYGPKLKQVTVSDNGQVWGLTSKGLLYNRQGHKWEYIKPSPKSQSVSVGHSGVWAVGERGAIWVRPGSYGGNSVGGQWKKIPGWLWKIHSTNGFVFGITKKGEVYKRVISHKNQFGEKWEKMNLKATSIAAKGNQLFGINKDAKLMKTVV